jgi:Ca2+-binding RTX toxin-like protein
MGMGPQWGRHGRLGLAAALSLAATAWAAAPADALTAKVSGATVLVDTDAGASDVRITKQSGHIVVEDRNGRENAGAGCDESGGAILCGASGIGRINVTLGLGDDRALAQSELGTIPVTIDGEGGDDDIAGGPGDDNIHGGPGKDALEGSNTTLFAQETASAGAGDDAIFGETGDDHIDGGIGADRISGGDGNNTVDAGFGDDQLIGSTAGGHTSFHGEDGDDRFFDSESGGDRFSGGPGDRDVADYSESDFTVQVTVATPAGTPNDFASGGKPDDIADAEVVVGGSKRDFLVAGGVGTELQGVAGDDDLEGGPGNDRLIGGNGADQMNGHAGADTVSYDDRSATVAATISPSPVSGNAADGPAGARDGMTGVENLEGGSGGDVLTGDSGENRLDGGPGADLLDGGAAGDTFADGTVSYQGRGEPVKVTVGAGANDGNLTDVDPDGTRDDLTASVEGVDGTARADDITGGSSGERLRGLGGDDVLGGAGGDDTILGGPGSDVLGGGNGVDTADYSDHRGAVALDLDDVADEGSDLNGDGISGPGEEADRIHDNVENLTGGLGPDRLRGNAAANALDGGPGDDRVNGAGGDDEVSGGPGLDTLLGDDGNDSMKSVDGEHDTVNCGDGPHDQVAADLADGSITASPPVNFAGCELRFEAPKDSYPVVHVKGRARLHRRALRARVRCPEALHRACRGRLEATNHPRGGHAFSHRRYAVRPGHAKTVALPLTGREVAHLRRAGHTRLTTAEHDPRGEEKLTLVPVRVLAGRRHRR